MVVVQVRETYDLCTVQNKMTLINVHTPHPDIIKRNFPGLLMQCKAYRPLRASVRIACASIQSLDPLGVGTTDGDVAPEDVFNPILYKAMTNLGMSQLEARISAIGYGSSVAGSDVVGSTAAADVDSNTPQADEFNIYYGLLSNAHGWRHAPAQSGLSMDDLRPLVYEVLYNVGDNISSTQSVPNDFHAPNGDGKAVSYPAYGIRGNAKPLPFINCTSYTYSPATKDGDRAAASGFYEAGFQASTDNNVFNSSITVPWINCCVAGIIIPPSRLHQLFYRMIVTWDIEFSGIRPLSEVMEYGDLGKMGQATHYQNYDYSSVKEVVTGDSESLLTSDSCMVSANVDVKKVM